MTQSVRIMTHHYLLPHTHTHTLSLPHPHHSLPTCSPSGCNGHRQLPHKCLIAHLFQGCMSLHLVFPSSHIIRRSSCPCLRHCVHTVDGRNAIQLFCIPLVSKLLPCVLFCFHTPSAPHPFSLIAGLLPFLHFLLLLTWLSHRCFLFVFKQLISGQIQSTCMPLLSLLLCELGLCLAQTRALETELCLLSLPLSALILVLVAFAHSHSRHFRSFSPPLSPSPPSLLELEHTPPMNSPGPLSPSVYTTCHRFRECEPRTSTCSPIDDTSTMVVAACWNPHHKPQMNLKMTLMMTMVAAAAATVSAHVEVGCAHAHNMSASGLDHTCGCTRAGDMW